jgi:transposase
LFEELQREGFAGGYDSVRRYVQQWKDREKNRQVKAFIPLSFAPGEAFQFDWSYEYVELGGVYMKVKVAHFRLCHSRMPFCVAYTRETLEMVMDAHIRAIEYFGGTCCRGIYDNMKTVVVKVLMGKTRTFNKKFQALASHYLFEPVACTPAAAWEKGQVENQVGVLRQRLFVPRLKFADLIELNRYLTDQCRTVSAGQKHPEFPDRTVAELFAEERKHLLRAGAVYYRGDGGSPPPRWYCSNAIGTACTPRSWAGRPRCGSTPTGWSSWRTTGWLAPILACSAKTRRPTTPGITSRC